MSTGQVPRMHDLPESVRPRERLWNKGAETLSDTELLALVLRSGRPGESALDLASRMLADFGSIQRIATAVPEEISSYPGIGTAKAASLVGALQLARRVANQGSDLVCVKRPADLALVAAEALAGARRERVVTLALDSGQRLVRVVQISEGASDRAMLPVREILNAVLRNDGRAFAVAHNHPGGDPSPTIHDLHAPETLQVAAKTTGLRFLDHFVVVEGGWNSLLSKESR